MAHHGFTASSYQRLTELNRARVSLTVGIPAGGKDAKESLPSATSVDLPQKGVSQPLDPTGWNLERQDEQCCVEDASPTSRGTFVKQMQLFRYKYIIIHFLILNWFENGAFVLESTS